MSDKVSLLHDAELEFDESVDWYEERVSGLGLDFAHQVSLALNCISSMPLAHAKVFKDVRKPLVSRFPFLIYYQLEGDEVVVISVFHTSRDSDQWQSRV